MAPLAHLPSLRSASLHAPKGLSFAAYALLAVLYALVGPALYQTSGEPLATATAHYSRLGATTKLDSATERRDPLQLQAALTDCAELMAADASFAASATAGRFDISRQLLRAMHDATAQLDAAADLADSGEASRAVASFTAALNRAAAPFAAEPAGPAGDFLPLLGAPVLRRHAGTLRVLLAKLGEAKSGDADFSAREEAERAADAAERTAAHAESMLPPDVEPVQTKLPPWYMPSFLPSVCALLLLLAHSLLHLGAHWNSGFRCLLYFHPTTQLRPGSHVLASPLAHRGKQEIVPVTPGDGGRLFIVFHKQKYECLGPEAAAAGGGYSDAAGAPGTAATGDKEADTAGGLVGLGGGACGAIVPVRCPVAEPLASYVESGGLSAARAEAAMRLYGKNEARCCPAQSPPHSPLRALNICPTLVFLFGIMIPKRELQPGGRIGFVFSGVCRWQACIRDLWVPWELQGLRAAGGAARARGRLKRGGAKENGRLRIFLFPVAPLLHLLSPDSPIRFTLVHFGRPLLLHLCAVLDPAAHVRRSVSRADLEPDCRLPDLLLGALDAR
jgi:hypothetical protein